MDMAPGLYLFVKQSYMAALNKMLTWCEPHAAGNLSQ